MAQYCMSAAFGILLTLCLPSAILLSATANPNSSSRGDSRCKVNDVYAGQSPTTMCKLRWIPCLCFDIDFSFFPPLVVKSGTTIMSECYARVECYGDPESQSNDCCDQVSYPCTTGTTPFPWTPVGPTRWFGCYPAFPMIETGPNSEPQSGSHGP